MPRRSIASLDPKLNEEWIEMRGVRFHLRELSIGRYDELVVQCTSQVSDALGGTVDKLDDDLFSKLLTKECVVTPQVTPARLAVWGTRMARQLQRRVNAMHFDSEPIKEIKPGDDEDDAEGTAPNAVD